tara:strand:- start:13503 stop:13958 length:456 start_codon:yes stop_codon:yes gene_type:complete
MTVGRQHSTRRRAIVESLKTLLETINGTGSFRTNVAEVATRLKFWDEVVDFPTIHIGAGNETREYASGNHRFRFLQVTLRCYVQDEDDVILALEKLLEDAETVLEDNDPFTYTDGSGNTQSTAQTTILSIDTDEGVLEPLGIGEIVCEIRY